MFRPVNEFQLFSSFLLHFSYFTFNLLDRRRLLLLWNGELFYCLYFSTVAGIINELLCILLPFQLERAMGYPTFSTMLLITVTKALTSIIIAVKGKCNRKLMGKAMESMYNAKMVTMFDHWALNKKDHKRGFIYS